jgi:hypothetical protein
LTENSGLLNLLIPGDTIFADRGFNIEDSVGIYCARVSIPAFTKGGKKQLTGIDVEQTRRIANVRIQLHQLCESCWFTGCITVTFSYEFTMHVVSFRLSKAHCSKK